MSAAAIRLRTPGSDLTGWGSESLCVPSDTQVRVMDLTREQLARSLGDCRCGTSGSG